MNHRQFVLLLLLMLWTPGFILASTLPLATSDSTSLMDWLQQLPGAVIQVRIETDMNELLLKKEEEPYQPAIITITSANQQPVRWNIRIRTRGNSRKKMCFYPPLKLQFQRKELTAAGLNPAFSSIRLINQCESTTQYRKYLEKEYLAYRLYNLVDTISLRARLAVITYVDAAGNNQPFECQALLVENEKELAERNHGKKINRDKFSYHLTDRNRALTMSTFQYMIGNTDFSISNLHNLFLLEVPAQANAVAVPYDFDFSGLVDAHYASPYSSLPIHSISERLYRGPSCTEEEVRMLASYFLEREADIMDYCSSFPFSDKRTGREAMRFLEGFFAQLRDMRRIRQQFSGK